MENNQILSNIGQVDTDGTSASTEAFNESLNVAPCVGFENSSSKSEVMRLHLSLKSTI